MLSKAISVAQNVHLIFEAGVNIAKTLLQICTVGVIATATLIAHLVGLNEKDFEANLVN